MRLLDEAKLPVVGNAAVGKPFRIKYLVRNEPRDDMARAFETRNPLGRAGRHDELTNLAAYLMADQSAYINGEVITIDGGEWLKGAGQFNFAERLGEDDWAAMKPKKK